MASSAKVAQKGEAAGAAAIVVEGADAGGHLGFSKGHEFRKTIDILKEVVQTVKIPVIAAGGILPAPILCKCCAPAPSAFKWQPVL